jgi:uncharacterized membrane protein YbhN (UPF0104 family)
MAGSRSGEAGRRRWPRIALVVTAVAVLATVIIVSRGTLLESLRNLGRLDWAWFLLAMTAEGVSLAAFGLSRRRLLRAEGHEAGLGSVMAITYASNALSMSIPFAGTQLAALFSYRQFRRRGLDPALTSWALAVSAIASSSGLALVLLTGALAGGAPAATALGFLGAAVFLVPGLVVLLALRYHRARRWLTAFAARLAGLLHRLLRRRVVETDALGGFLDRVASIRLTPAGYAEVSALAMLNWLADCACLACAIKAAGQPVPWQGLLLAYGAGATAGSTGVTPGGFALVEIALTAALVAAGLHASGALTAVLAYRLVNFWLILLGGGIAVVVLSRAAHRIRAYAQPGRDDRAPVSARIPDPHP